MGKCLDKEFLLISRGNSVYFQRYEHICGELTSTVFQVPTQLLHHSSFSSGEQDRVKRSWVKMKTRRSPTDYLPITIKNKTDWIWGNQSFCKIMKLLDDINTESLLRQGYCTRTSSRKYKVGLKPFFFKGVAFRQQVVKCWKYQQIKKLFFTPTEL